MGQKNAIANNISELVKEFTQSHCNKCNLYVFCCGEMVLSCNKFIKFLSKKE